MPVGLSGKLNIVGEGLPFELLGSAAELPIQDRSEESAPSAPREQSHTGPLRTSSYTIYVDLPGNREEMLLVHGYTGAYDKVSRRVATYLRSLEPRRPPKPLYGDWIPEPSTEGEVPPPSQKSIELLKKRGYLTEMTRQAEETRLADIAVKLHQHSLRQAPQYIIMPTYDCNLRCSYCFQDHMRSDPRFGHLLRRMEPEVADRILAAMPQIEALHGLNGDDRRHRTFLFFGGEPLLEANRPIVQYLIEGALGMGTASFSAVTNATDLHAYRDLLSPERISRLQITIDGPPEEHNRRRIYADGSGSYERITRNIDLALDLGVEVSIRLNLDRNNIGDLPALAEDFLARGWDRHPRFSTYTAPIRPENGKTSAKTTFNTWELDKFLVEMLDRHPELAIIGRPDNSIKSKARRIFDASGAATPNLRESFCSAHHRMYIFDALGDIYACWERTGDPKIRIGHIEEDGLATLNREVAQLWRSRTVASNPVCRQCRYALHCGGGCAILAVDKTGRYHANFCDGFASRFRANVAEAYLDHTRGVEIVDRGGRVCDQ